MHSDDIHDDNRQRADGQPLHRQLRRCRHFRAEDANHGEFKEPQVIVERMGARDEARQSERLRHGLLYGQGAVGVGRGDALSKETQSLLKQDAQRDTKTAHTLDDQLYTMKLNCSSEVMVEHRSFAELFSITRVRMQIVSEADITDFLPFRCICSSVSRGNVLNCAPSLRAR